MKSTFITYTLLLLTVIGISACSKSSNSLPSTDTLFTANLGGASETPANASLAAGSASFTYNSATKRLTGVVEFAGFTTTVIASHIHQGAAGVAGSAVFTIVKVGPVTSPISITTPALTESQITDLMDGNYYVDIHSIAFLDGEIRGQLIKQTSGSDN